MIARPFLFAILGAAALLVQACTEGEPAGEPKTSNDLNIKGSEAGRALFGEEGLFTDDPYSDGRAIGVNSFLWRASLDTISFMPVASADPFGGVIITDWYSASESPAERFKLNVYILGRALRADGVRVAVFRQVLDSAGGWRDSALADTTATKIEDAILSRARQLRSEILRTQ
ncbi:MAG: DUF3576 domain-containing protein [Rhodospirillaceae bacterium]|nr:DUF3576 domain-containing protein [Rhodospirillaceae bacterium]MBT5013706.1 DUF3576 domain-containing protein [Rhodospirillaceae bacterium]MBT5309405.1 DUF3576 domain-containing protein [Rhodospirillaceae bacterium]MBT6406491.1 DUF3576 domain-containing protein [Rhodospirillaceae bacterium]MBT7356580.1 DUF3576 domain-containing protein [Rhodospirillaceae bacterium]